MVSKLAAQEIQIAQVAAELNNALIFNENRFAKTELEISRQVDEQQMKREM